MTRPIALTLGDPAGIGGEIALRAWAALRDELAFFVIGDLRHMAGLAARLGTPVREVAGPEAAAAAMPDGLPVLPLPLPAPAPPGRPDPANAPAVVAAIERGVALTRSGAALALCTGPIHKPALQQGAGFGFPGHTEFLAHLCGAPHPGDDARLAAAARGARDRASAARGGARRADRGAARDHAADHPRRADRRLRRSPRRGSPSPG